MVQTALEFLQQNYSENECQFCGLTQDCHLIDEITECTIGKQGLQCHPVRGCVSRARRPTDTGLVR